MIIFLFVIALIFSLIPLKLEIKDRSPFFLLWIFNIVFVLFPLVVSFGSGNYTRIILIYALIYYISANIVYVISLMIFRKIEYFTFKNTIRIENLPLEGYRHTDKLVFFFVIGILFIFLYQGISFNRFFSSTLEDKRTLGGFQLLLLMLLSCVTPFSLYYFLRREVFKAVILLFVFIIVLLYFRSRSLMSLFFLPVAYYLFFWVKKGKFYLLVFGGLTYLLSQIIKVIRYQGALSDGLSISTISEKLPEIIASNFKVGNGDLSIVEFYIKVIEDFDVANWSGNWLFFKKLFYLFIPFSDSIKSVEYELWDYYFSFGTNGSMHPTLYGVTYADGGVYGVVFFIFIAIIRILIQRLLIITNDLRLLGVVMYFILFCSRGSLYNSFILLLLSCVIWVFFRFLFLRNKI